jgi:hypothetical protein
MLTAMTAVATSPFESDAARAGVGADAAGAPQAPTMTSMDSTRERIGMEAGLGERDARVCS